MENPSHSHSHSHSHSKKSSSNVYPGKTVYVFGGPPKFGVPTLSLRLEDYKEIFENFQSSRPSSIPVLDLPVFKEEEEDLSFDVQSSNFDYSQVFGGFNSLDFAVPYQDLFKQTNPRDDSSDEDWTPAQSESLSDESEPSASFEKNQYLPNEDPHQSINDTKQFNISYNKSNSKGKEDILNGMACVTHLQAVPGFTFVVNETPPSRKMEEESSNLRVTNDLNLSRDFGGGPHTEGRQLRKTMSQPSNSNFVSLSNISLRTQPSDLPAPSRPPPGLAVKRGNSDGLKSKLRVTKSCTFERMSGESSPPYFDVEIDASSSAAASAAAMKDAVEKAQAKLRSAKELMERKKDGQSRSKLRLDSHIKNQEKNVTESFERPSSYEGEKVKGTCEREFSVMKPYAVEERGKVMEKIHVYSGTVEEERYINVAAQRVCEWEENVNILGVAQQHREVKKTLNEADKSKELENLREIQLKENQVEAVQKLNEADEEIETDEIFEDAHETKENDTRKSIGTFKRQEYERELKESTERAENEKRVKESLELEENEKQQQEACEREENEKKQKEAREREENEKQQKEARERAENEKQQKEARERAENEKQQKEACKRAENEKQQTEARKRAENEKKQKEAREREENEKKHREAREREDNEKQQKEARKRAENEKKQKEAREREEKEMKQKEAREREENEKKQKEAREREENEMKQKEASEKEDYEKKQKEAREREESDKKQKEACEIGEKEKRLEEALEQEGNEKRSKEAFEEELACERGQNEKLLRGALNQEENKNNLKEAIQQKENAKVAEKVYEGETNEKRLNDACEREENDQRFKEGGHCVIEESEKNAQVVFKEEGNEDRSKGVNEGDETDNRVKYADNLEGLRGENDDQGQADKEDNERKLNSAEKIYAHPMEQNCEEADGACKLDDDETPHVTRVTEEHVTNNGKLGATQDTLSCEEDGKVRTKPKGCGRELEVVEGKVKGKSTNASQKVNRHSLERKEKKNLNETHTRGERKNEERVKRERELENDRLRKIEEEREREREREKDRMAVDRAIHEARERVFAEARERAERAAVERATAEFRQRAMAEARERLEKAATEARLRAERVAVEKATAEARERAVEKAMAERSVADKFSVSSRSGGVRQNSSSSDLQDPQFQGVVSSSEARHVNSSVHGGVEDESPQRCKARLERHRRTAERAAKALAEKNMRDLLTQREQTERNRLAETLDAEVKRWSSGKEGNLRALLSTLQYILGPDSGWQPIPLTDVITTVAVKKAYRKATLCVHPDKLQQRGASIHQKYICEKVFDLLKEAWHKYNSEER